MGDYEITQPKPITEERFWEMLEVMPPERWHHIDSFEVFHVMEHLTGDLVSWFAHNGDRYWEFNESCFISDEDLFSKLKAVL